MWSIVWAPATPRPFYTGRMTTVAEVLRLSLRERTRGLTPDARVALTARLAEDDSDFFCAAGGTSREDGRRLLRGRRHSGRLPSRAAREDEP